jgi:predicted RNase H-like nuclease (RuvC/YqgF family)
VTERRQRPDGGFLNTTEQRRHTTVTTDHEHRLADLETVVTQLSKNSNALYKRVVEDTDRIDGLIASVQALNYRIEFVESRPRPLTLWSRLYWLLYGA